MSWSVNAIGKSEPVAVKVAADFARITFLQGDEAVLKDIAADLVAKAVAAQPAGTAVKVDCSGSGGSNGQTVRVSVDQMYGFIE